MDGSLASSPRRVFVSLVLGAPLSAPLWLPFLAESGQVGIALGPSQGYREHLAPLADAIQASALYRYREVQSDTTNHPLAWTTVALLALVTGLAAWRIVRKLPIRGGWLVAYFILLTIGSAFMSTAPSLRIVDPAGTAPGAPAISLAFPHVDGGRRYGAGGIASYPAQPIHRWA